MNDAILTGFSAGLSLILAIGSQNAFVLRQGLRGEHVGLVCLACALSDAILISLGVVGFRQVSAMAGWLVPLFRWCGAAFLLTYGALRFRAAFGGSESLAPADGGGAPLWPTLAPCLALTWLNPHVYLDTVILLGSISTRFPGQEMHFALGAMTASCLFFFSLGYGARLLRPLFATHRAWQVLDVVVGITMWVIAVQLVLVGSPE